MSKNLHFLRYSAVLAAALFAVSMAGQPVALAQAGASTAQPALQLSEVSGPYADEPSDLMGAPEEPAETGATYARLLYYEGGISLRRPADLRVPEAGVSVNSPLVPGDEIWTGADGRVEIQLADGSFLRLDRDARLSMLNLADFSGSFDTTTLLRLPNGSLYINATNFDARERRFQVDTPSGSVFLLSEGIFRIDVSASGTTSVASFRGVAEILSEQSSVVVHSGERLSAGPGRPPGEPQAFNTLRRDEFDLWADSRDDAIASARSVRGPDPGQVPAPVRPYVSELSAYGTWQDTPEYGWVWLPDRDDPDWRPYFYGSWVWAPIGVVWVATEPWGYAPYHYGRWHWTVGLGWFWAPGYVYSGAYVQWAVGPTWYGWCPLGYYGTPVIYAGHHGHHYHWTFVHHSHFYRHHVDRHVYSYADVARLRVHDRSHYLRSYPRAHPRYRPEDSGRRTYERANRGEGVRPRESDRPVQRVSFRDHERRELTRRSVQENAPGLGSPRGRILHETGATSGRGGGEALHPRGSLGRGRSQPARQAPLTRVSHSRRSVTSQPARISPVSGRSLGRPVARIPNASDDARRRSHVRSDRKATDDRGVVPRMGNSPRAPSPRSSRNIGPRTTYRSRPQDQELSPGRSTVTRPHARVTPRRSSRGNSPFVMVPRDRSRKDAADMRPRSRSSSSKSTINRSRGSSRGKTRPPSRGSQRSGGRSKGGKKK